MKCSEMYQQARNYFNSGDTEKALQIFEDVITQCPDTHESEYAQSFINKIKGGSPEDRYYGTIVNIRHKKSISSSWTFVYKFILPILWIIFSLSPMKTFYADFGSNVPFIFAWSIGTIFIFWYCIRLKQVAVDPNYIYISNFFKSIEVPLYHIEKITENRLINIHPVYISFKRTTEFGDKVVFTPIVRLFHFPFSSHPIVEELSALVAKNVENKYYKVVT